jgi:Secretion system C-terminal sorting domain
MRKSFLFLFWCLLIGLSMSISAQTGTDQVNAMATVYPMSADYWTGTTDGATKTDVSQVRGWNTEDGWFDFDVSSIPAGSTIDSIRFYGYVDSTHYPFWSATPLPSLDPLTATATDLETAISGNSGSGVAYIYANETSTFPTGWHNYLMGNTANADLEAALSQGWFAMGMDSRDNSATYYINWDGWNQANLPYLEVYYSAGSNIFEDNFDSYTAGMQLACQSPDWTTWSTLPCDPTEDPYISTNYAYSGANSVVIVQNNDLVKTHGMKTSGKWYISFLFYIPTGETGYFNALSGYTPNPFEWGLECYFNAGGAGSLSAGSATPYTFTWLENTWQQVIVVVDLDNDLAEFWIGASNPLTQIASWQWTLGSSGGGSVLELDGNDFFGAAATDEMYMDNFYFGDVPPVIIPVEFTSFTSTVNESTVTLDWSTATETNNKGFEIERSNGNEFVSVGFVDGHGTTTEIQNYSFTDRNVAVGSYTYRLKQIDFDGTFAYSSVVEADVTGPKEFALDQNYPNPFNPSTKITFRLKEDSKVSLKVFNVLGEEVMTLINSDLATGFHQVDFNAKNLNSGVYFYRLEANGINGEKFADVKKMMLTK